MTRLLDQLIQKYDAASVFVAVATAAVILELALMRLLVPVSSASGFQESDFVMEEVYGASSMADTSKKIVTWELGSSKLLQRLPNTSSRWQKELVTLHAFGSPPVTEEVLVQTVNEKTEQDAVADRATKSLKLQSVMTGRKPLANINGKIYGVGDKITIRNGEYYMLVKELGTDYAVVQLMKGDVETIVLRTIYVTRDIRLLSGEQSQ